tara:strand:+ start:198 stop:476 length:279 start_codon:yes stop_codon:yes gene_type:complete
MTALQKTMNKTEAELLLRLVAAEIDMQEAQMRNFRWDIISILVFAFLWYALLFTYIEHQSDRRLERIEKLLEKESVPVGHVKLQPVESDIKV